MANRPTKYDSNSIIAFINLEVEDESTEETGLGGGITPGPECGRGEVTGRWPPPPPYMAAAAAAAAAAAVPGAGDRR